MISILEFSPYRNQAITENSMTLYTGETLAASTICTAIIALVIGFIIGLMFTGRKGNGINRNTSSISNHTNGNRSPVEIASNGKLKMISAGTEIYDKTLKLKRYVNSNQTNVNMTASKFLHLYCSTLNSMTEGKIKYLLIVCLPFG